jgi:hypothetical protein
MYDLPLDIIIGNIQDAIIGGTIIMPRTDGLIDIMRGNTMDIEKNSVVDIHIAIIDGRYENHGDLSKGFRVFLSSHDGIR